MYKYPQLKGSLLSKQPNYVNLSFEEFDQPGAKNPVRPLFEKKEYVTAANMIQIYINANKHRLKPHERQTLHFHRAQCYAFNKEYSQAIKAFKSAINSQQPKDSPVDMNAYIHATIAFLESDPEQLKYYRDVIAKGKTIKLSESIEIVANLHEVNTFLANIDCHYSEAYTTAQQTKEESISSSSSRKKM